MKVSITSFIYITVRLVNKPECKPSSISRSENDIKLLKIIIKISCETSIFLWADPKVLILNFDLRMEVRGTP